MNKKRLLIVDASNQFMRAYIINPQLSTKTGEPIGGVVGFLKILQKLVRETEPHEVVICWDGLDGSMRRRQIFSEYKTNRKDRQPKLNRNAQLPKEDEKANKLFQQAKLIEYLNEFPFIQLMFDHIEADDVVSYVHTLKKYDDWFKFIVSSDKDFIQLLDKSTVLMRPTQNEALNFLRVVESYQIHPNNFALARAISGDKSDNIPGIPGAGLKTIAKRFDFLVEDKEYMPQDIINYAQKCVENDIKLKIYNKILEEKQKIFDNFKIMNLKYPMMSAQSMQITKNSIENFKPVLNKTEIEAMFLEDGIDNLPLSDLYRQAKRIVG